MLIINADDWGRSKVETDAALSCFLSGRITSVTAMMFMEDSARAAELAREYCVPAGLHLNLNQPYTGIAPSSARESQYRVARFLNCSKFSVLIYHPGLREHFRHVFHAQMNEFVRLYGKAPTHVDGHQHRHLCANMLLDEVIPRGLKVRRNFTFWPDEKGLINRVYRSVVDKRLRARYGLTDYFFSLVPNLGPAGMKRVVQAASNSNVELMTHPANKDEYDWLMSDHHLELIRSIRTMSYASL
jgi:chitin disaccharide deacetylase